MKKQKTNNIYTGSENDLTPMNPKMLNQMEQLINMIQNKQNEKSYSFIKFN